MQLTAENLFGKKYFCTVFKVSEPVFPAVTFPTLAG